MLEAYAGIGSRKIEDPILFFNMRNLGEWFAAEHKLILRSGGAEGSDSAFEQGCDDAQGIKEIFLPWKRFNGNTSPYFQISEGALNLASQFHPNWEKLNQATRKLMARNCYQVLGKELNNPVKFICCYCLVPWTGGTSQALRIASHFNIPIFNLYELTVEEIKSKVKELLS